MTGNDRIIPFFITMIVMAIVLMGFMINGALWFGCSQYAKATGRDVKFHHFDQCYVKVDSQWYPKTMVYAPINGEIK